MLVYLRTAEGNDALAWVDKQGNSVTESQFAILKAAAVRARHAGLPRHDNHHELVRKGVELIVDEEKSVGGQLGRPSGARFRTYERLKRYAEEVKGTLFDTPGTAPAPSKTSTRYPLRQSATDTLNRQLTQRHRRPELAELVIELREEGRLCIIHEEEQTRNRRSFARSGLRKPVTED